MIIVNYLVNCKSLEFRYIEYQIREFLFIDLWFGSVVDASNIGFFVVSKSKCYPCFLPEIKTVWHYSLRPLYVGLLPDAHFRNNWCLLCYSMIEDLDFSLSSYRGRAVETEDRSSIQSQQDQHGTCSFWVSLFLSLLNSLPFVIIHTSLVLVLGTY